MIPPLGAQPNAGGFIEPEPPALRLLLGDLESLLEPDPLDALAVDLPLLPAQEGMDAPVPVAPIVASELYGPLPEELIEVRLPGLATLGRPVLLYDSAGSAL